MKENCHVAPKDKKKYISEVGKILIKDYGKKKYYQPEEIKKSSKKSVYYSDIDYACWAMCVFSSRSDFDNYHNSIGEICNYSDMKSEMLSGLAISEHTDWLDNDTSWLDYGDSGNGIGDFFGSLFDFAD